ncbi:MAG: ABC-ATPase domain-containing protein, partial [Cyanobacteria bacterium P01_C01_bin.73]
MSETALPSEKALRQTLNRLDGQNYKAYKSIKGRYLFADFTLQIDHVQGDPFAAPSQVRVFISQSAAQFPVALFQSSSRQTALEDFLIRQFDQGTRQFSLPFSPHRGSGKSGLIAISLPSQAILPRTAAFVDQQQIEVRFTVGLPAFGRRIAGRQAVDTLCETLPKIVQRSLRYSSLNPDAIRRHVETAEDADWLRSQLAAHNLIGFVADGAVLPRCSGVDERPLDNAIAFQSPDSLRVSFNRPNGGKITGMGIPRGITLIVGGGYHGKSTLLRAIEQGVYDHIPGDGREWVVSDPRAVKIRAEDGRSVAGVNISPFINCLPQGRSTEQFSTTNASGSTSQAASTIEAIAAGATSLLVDEDTAATNFMIRDRRMQALIAKAKEPITPFIDKIDQLYRERGISTLLVMGGSGDYFEVAHTVIAMENYKPADLTAAAKAIAKTYATHRTAEGGKTFGPVTPRRIDPRSLDPSKGKREVNLKVRRVDQIGFGSDEIDLSAVEQLIESGQLRAIAAAMVYAQQRYINGQQDLNTVL